MNKENIISLKGLVVWIICAFFFMYEFMLRTVLGTFQYPLMHDLQLSPVRFAVLSSTAYQLIYGLMQIPVGIITDRYGLKKTLLFAVLFCAFANFGFAMAHEFYSAIAFRILMGLGSSFGFVCLLIAVYDWMPRKNIALFIGISQFIGTMGPMLAAGPFNMLAKNAIFSWREIFFGLGLVGFILAALVLFFVDKNRESTGKFIILTRPAAISDNLKQLLRFRQIWFIAIFSAGVYFSIEYLSENEGVAFLIQKGFSSTFSSYMITVAWLGYAISCPLLGYLSDKMQRRKPVMILGAVSALISLVAIIYFPLGKAMMMVCFFLLGLGASSQSIGFAIMAEQCKDEFLAIGLAVNNAGIMLFAASNAPLIGYILSRTTATGQPPGVADYQEAFFIMIAMMVFAFVFSLAFIKETFCKSMRENLTLNPKHS